MKERIWQLQEAKNRFSQLVNRALAEGPQIVTRHGEAVVVVLSRDEYSRLQQSQVGLLEYFRESPLVGVELDLVRDRSQLRDVDL